MTREVNNTSNKLALIPRFVDANTLGTESFGTFYAERGMRSLHTILEKHPEMLQSTRIVTDSGVDFTITEFMDRLDKLKLLFN